MPIPRVARGINEPGIHCVVSLAPLGCVSILHDRVHSVVLMRASKEICLSLSGELDSSMQATLHCVAFGCFLCNVYFRKLHFLLSPGQ